MKAIFVLAAALALGACSTEYEFDSVEVGTHDESRTPRPKNDGQFLRSVYGDLLGRAPGQFDLTFSDESGYTATYPIDEEEYLLFVMDGSGDTDSMRDMVIAGLVDNAEATIPEKSEVDDPEAFVVGQFRELLGREPSSYELDSFVSAWATNEAVGPRVIVRAIAGSREYQSQ